MIRLVSKSERRRDEDLARYFAFRCHVWRKLHPGKDWAVLARLLNVKPPELTALQKGRNGSPAKIENFVRALGPPTEDEFKSHARAWAEKYPHWKATDPLPDRIEFTGDALLDGVEGVTEMFSDELRAAVRALPVVMRCTPDELRAAAETAWRVTAEKDRWALGAVAWMGLLQHEISRIRTASGERPSGTLKASSP